MQRTKVFVGSLPTSTQPEDLRRLFEKFGVVTECDILNRCGFVHLATQEQADNAIKALNNSLFNGANIVVERGRIKERAPAGNNMRMGNNAMGANGHFNGGGFRGNNNNQNNNDNTKRFNNNRGPGMGPQTGNRRNDLGMYNSVVLENNH